MQNDGSAMKANFHTHTARCRHARGADREYVESAIRAGLSVLGFSDHSPYFFPNGYYSSHRMFPEDTEGYIQFGAGTDSSMRYVLYLIVRMNITE